MYPNPQAALPLPSRPNVEQYKKLAKDLVKACKAGSSAAIEAWATRWIQALAAGQEEPRAFRGDADLAGHAAEIAGFARQKLARGETSPKCALSDAQFVIARAHGFLSWPRFRKHIESLAQPDSAISGFETAATAVVRGDIRKLERLLRGNPDLIREVSTREHRATLLHYVSANGVEGYRQVSPKNAAHIAEFLLAAGAEVDATADVYGGGCTALGLVATSEPPRLAGVQQDVMDVLLKHGARMDNDGLAGNRHTLVYACLANGQPAAAEYLANRGAPLDLASASGVGRLDAVKEFFDSGGRLRAESQLADAFAMACGYGHVAVVEFLLDRGFEINAPLNLHGEGHTGLHVAAFHGHFAVVNLLLNRGARVDVIAKTWPTPPLLWALTGWTLKKGEGQYYDMLARLVAAGSTIRPDVFDWQQVKADPRMLTALKARTV